MKNSAEIQADFDRIALAQTHEGWNHNNHYHAFLLRHAPPACHDALEVGCGTGDFARLLAQRSAHVLALDLSPVMLRLAREQSAADTNIDYVQADIMTAALPAAHFDCIASIATLHHMPLQDVLPKLKAALKPGGVLLVLDLFKAESLSDWLIAAAGVPVNQVLKRTHHANVQHSPEAQRSLGRARSNGRVPDAGRGAPRLRRIASGRAGQAASALALLAGVDETGHMSEGY